MGRTCFTLRAELSPWFGAIAESGWRTEDGGEGGEQRKISSLSLEAASRDEVERVLTSV